jgi:hypothetical protein
VIDDDDELLPASGLIEPWTDDGSGGLVSAEPADDDHGPR